MAVGELAGELPVSRPAVSQHLRVLKDAGLVRERAEGTRRVYRVDLDGVAAVRSYFDRFWDQALADFKAEAERGKGAKDEHDGSTCSDQQDDHGGRLAGDRV